MPIFTYIIHDVVFIVRQHFMIKKGPSFIYV